MVYDDEHDPDVNGSGGIVEGWHTAVGADKRVRRVYIHKGAFGDWVYDYTHKIKEKGRHGPDHLYSLMAKMLLHAAPFCDNYYNRPGYVMEVNTAVLNAIAAAVAVEKPHVAFREASPAPSPPRKRAAAHEEGEGHGAGVTSGN